MRLRAEAGLLFNTVVWGATFVLVKSALADISPFLYLSLRFLLAALAMILILRRPFFEKLSWRMFAAGALSGSFLFAGFALQTFGLRLTTPAKSAFLTGLTSVAVPLLAAAVYKTRPQLREAAGVAAAVGGLALMTFQGEVGRIERGDLLTLLGAIAFAAHIVTLAHFGEFMAFEVLSVSQIAAAAFWAAVLLGALESPRVQWSPPVIFAVLITGLLATAVAFTLQSWAMRHTTSTRTALIYMFEPVVALITSYLWEGEALSSRATAGAALILLGIALVEVKRRGLSHSGHPLASEGS